jgi:hypothetical protein
MKSSTVKKLEKFSLPHVAGGHVNRPFARGGMAYCVHPRKYWAAKFSPDAASGSYPTGHAFHASKGQTHASPMPDEFESERETTSELTDAVVRFPVGERATIIDVSLLREMAELLESELGAGAKVRVALDDQQFPRLHFQSPRCLATLAGCKQ